MPQKFVNLENLTSFWGNAKEYIGNERKEIEDQLYNWQKTEKAPVVQCEPVPNSELHPTVDFSFTEILPAEGEKSIENPSTITGINSIVLTKCSKNILPSNAAYSRMAQRGITATKNSDGSWHLSGTAANDATPYLSFFVPASGTVPNALARGKTITISLICSSQNVNCVLYDSASEVDGGNGFVAYANSHIIHTISSDAKTVMLQLRVTKGTTVDCDVYLQVEYGDTATEWEAPADTDYTISLGNTYYGGSIDLSTGKMIVKKIKVVMTTPDAADTISQYGGATFRIWPVNFSEYPRVDILDDGKELCDKLPLDTTSDVLNRFYVGTRNAGNLQHPVTIVLDKNLLNLSNAVDPNNPTAGEVRTAGIAYFTANPLTFIFTVAEPFVIDLNLNSQQIKSLPSLEGTSKRTNIIYTDADSVQVEYQKYVGIDSTLDNISVNAIQNKVVNSALNTKVSLSGDETINGTKTFSNTINGNITGDAGTVAGHIVSKDVPVNAAFTDTTYDPATQSTAGLMSASDKVKLDAVGSVFSFKGSVTDSSSLPASDNVNGDAYLAEDTGHVHVYDGSSFVDIGVWAGIPSATDAQIDALFED